MVQAKQPKWLRLCLIFNNKGIIKLDWKFFSMNVKHHLYFLLFKSFTVVSLTNNILLMCSSASLQKILSFGHHNLLSALHIIVPPNDKKDCLLTFTWSKIRIMFILRMQWEWFLNDFFLILLIPAQLSHKHLELTPLFVPWPLYLGFWNIQYTVVRVV